jgi:hypothetical protein
LRDKIQEQKKKYRGKKNLSFNLEQMLYDHNKKPFDDVYDKSIVDYPTAGRSSGNKNSVLF